MNTRIVNIIGVATVFLALSACSTVSVQELSEKYDESILSAADVESMIRVEVAALEIAAGEDTLAIAEPIAVPVAEPMVILSAR